MASGDPMADQEGLPLVDDDGNPQVDDGEGNVCCCGTGKQAWLCDGEYASGLWMPIDNFPASSPNTIYRVNGICYYFPEDEAPLGPLLDQDGEWFDTCEDCIPVCPPSEVQEECPETLTVTLDYTWFGPFAPNIARCWGDGRFEVPGVGQPPATNVFTLTKVDLGGGNYAWVRAADFWYPGISIYCNPAGPIWTLTITPCTSGFGAPDPFHPTDDPYVPTGCPPYGVWTTIYDPTWTATIS